VPLETAGAVAKYERTSQRMTVWANTNMYHYSAMPFAGTLKVDPNKFSIRPGRGRGKLRLQAPLEKVITIAGILSKATGRPVKFMEDRIDNLAASDSHAPTGLTRPSLRSRRTAASEPPDRRGRRLRRLLSVRPDSQGTTSPR